MANDTEWRTGPARPAIACDYLTLRAVYPEGVDVKLPAGPLWCDRHMVLPDGTLPGHAGARLRLAHGGMHLTLPGRWWWEAGTEAGLRSLVECLTLGVVHMSMVRVDWAIESARWQTTVDEQLVTMAWDAARRVLPQPRSGWCDEWHRSETGITFALGVRGRDASNCRARDYFIRAYVKYARRDVVRVEVERKKFPGVPVTYVWQQTLDDARRMFPGREVNVMTFAPPPWVDQTQTAVRMLKQVYGMHRNFRRRGGDVTPMSPAELSAWQLLAAEVGVSDISLVFDERE